MNKTWLILRHEVSSLLSRFSFWFSVLGVPLIAFTIFMVINAVNQSQGGSAQSAPSPMASLFANPDEGKDLPQGYVDEAGLIRKVPASIPTASLIAYPSLAAARQALQTGQVGIVFVIPKDYLQTGNLTGLTPKYDVISSSGSSDTIESLITYNLLNGDEPLIGLVENPLKTEQRVSLAPQDQATPVRDKNSVWTFMLPYATMMLLFIAIMGSSTLLLNSVAKEKENRIMEILMVTANPSQFLLGKIIGLGLVGLLQMVIWAGSALTIMRVSGRSIQIPAGLQVQPALLGWGVVFFLLGYLVYAALMAGIGALVPSLKEASQATTLVTLPLFAPLFIISALIEAPNSGVAVALSLFPFTAPTTMMLRLAAGPVPLWQILTAAALLVITDWLVIRAVAGMFRAQTLMSGQSFNVKRFVLALAGRG